MADKTVEKSRNAKSDLNRADRDELVAVSGIGPAGAESILKHRGDRGGFKSLDELSDVTGIGAQAVQNLRKRFTISGKRAGAAASSKGETNDKSVEKSRNAKSDLNRADRDELVAVPGIGPAGAESILKHRGARGGFKSMDELSDVTGIGAQTVQNLRERFTISGKRAGAAASASKGEAKAPETSPGLPRRRPNGTLKSPLTPPGEALTQRQRSQAGAPTWRGMRANAQLKLRRRPARPAWRHSSVSATRAARPSDQRPIPHAAATTSLQARARTGSMPWLHPAEPYSTPCKNSTANG